MAKLDQLIDALVKHSAESLVLNEGTKPALIINGSSRPIVKTELDISQMRQLAAEVTPSHQRDDVMAGKERPRGDPPATRRAGAGAGADRATGT